jgi:3-hydroxybutyryl-CoA dehydrogenase
MRDSGTSHSFERGAPGDAGNVDLANGTRIEFSKPVLIVGAGNIGRMIAERFLIAGQPVHLVDLSQEQLDGARVAFETILKREISDQAQRDELLGRCGFSQGDLSTDPVIHEKLRNARLVIEALPELRDLKGQVLGCLDVLVPRETPIATVSSSFPIGELLSNVHHAGRFINAHPLQKGIDAIEMMPSAATEQAINEQVSAAFGSIGMVPIQVQQENVGFIFNILWKKIKETSLDLVARGVARPEDIDRLWMMALKTKIGPFGIMDMVGLDVVRDIEARYAQMDRQKYNPAPPLLEKMVSEKCLGVKTGKGFYSYPSPAYAQPGFIENGLPRTDEEFTPTRDTLVGTWKLVSFTAKIVGGDRVLYPMGEDAQGQLMYGADGAMSVYLTRPNRVVFASADPLAASESERAAGFSEFFSYFGKFRYGQGIVYHDVQFCSFPNWEGSTVVRSVSIGPDGTLTLATPPFALNGSLSVQELTWKRA